MKVITSIAVTAIILCLPNTASAQVEIETFDNGNFNNPFFIHNMEFDDPCCWSIPPNQGDFELYLHPNADLVTFDLQGLLIESISFTIRDFEGGFAGNLPSSAVIVRASSNDFVALHAATIAVEETLTADINTIGQLFNKPLGDIVSLHFQVANEGNSQVPGIGAYFDDITINLIEADCAEDLDGDNTVGTSDLLELFSQWGTDGPADFDDSGAVDTADLLILFANWGPCL